MKLFKGIGELAALLGVSVRDLRIYVRRQKMGTKFKRSRVPPIGRKHKGSLSANQPRASVGLLIASKESPRPGSLPPGLLTIMVKSDSDENQLYEKWRDAPDEEKPILQQQLFQTALKHAKAVVWDDLGQDDPHLPGDIASAAIHQLPSFRQESKFSTYVHQIAKNKVMETKRKLARHRKRFDVNADYEKELEKHRQYDVATHLDQRVLLLQLSKGLNPQEGTLLDLLSDDRDTSEIAVAFNITPAAAESRIRRLKAKLRKKIKSN